VAAAGSAAAPQATPAPPVTAIAPPTPPDEDLSYNSRLEGKEPPRETVKPPVEPATAPAATSPAKGQAASDAGKPATATKEAPPRVQPDAAKAKAEVPLAAEPAGAGYYLKVIAYRDRGQADGLAKRLGSKGYSAYVVPAAGLYSVRVGKYKSRKEADTIKRRLEKDEQLKPLIAH
jgi:cell division protein FtsN